jgi:hypothetical protein
MSNEGSYASYRDHYANLRLPEVAKHDIGRDRENSRIGTRRATGAPAALELAGDFFRAMLVDRLTFCGATSTNPV